MILFILVFTFLLVMFINYVILDNNYWKKRGIVQFNGVLWTFIAKSQSIATIYKNLYNMYPNEKYIGIYLSKPAVIVKDIQDIQAVLQTDFQSFNVRGFVNNSSDILADNVLFSNDYKRWRLWRQKLSPVFTSKKLKNMFFIMNDCARNFVKQIDNYENEKINSFDILYTYNTACVTATIFSVDTPPHDVMNSPFLKMTKRAIEPSFTFNLKQFIGNVTPTLFKILNIKVFAEHENFFIGTVKKVIKIRQNDTQLRYDFIDTCIELQKLGKLKDLTTGYELDPTPELLAAQAFFFFIAGIDTATIAMHFTLLELASNPHILKRLHCEIDTVFAKSNKNPSYDDVNNMVYLDMVINEAMRKYPPIGSLQRLCTRDTTLPGGLTLEKGNIAVVPVFALHRNEKYFPKPEMFDPERFSPENADKVKKFSYLPFGEGSRICLGLRYTKLQIKAGLIWLLRKYTLKEQNYEPTSFDNSFFAVRDFKAQFELIPRIIDIQNQINDDIS